MTEKQGNLPRREDISVVTLPIVLATVAWILLLTLGSPFQYVSIVLSMVGAVVLVRKWRVSPPRLRLVAAVVCAFVLLFSLYFELTRPITATRG
ncbi:hypothetical protein [Rhodococcus sp. 077-4]|uniref:hypothetical protein n=1 Tax=Rhodococcus sp. 077-4 TaxID=2789271 RepID=UPI0039F4EB3F